MPAVRRRHEDVADPLLVVPFRLREDDADGHGPFVLPVIRRDVAAKGGADDILCGADVDAGARERATVEHDLQLRDARVAIEAEIDDTRYLVERCDALLERPLHDVEIGPEHLQHDLAPHAADGLFDVVLDRLREVVADARDLRERRPHRLDEPVLVESVAPLLLLGKVHERLAHVHSLVVRAVLGPSLFAHRLEHFREGEQAPAHLGEHLGAAIERDARRHLDEDDEVAFIQLGKELASEPPADDRGRDDQHGNAARDDESMADQPSDRARVRASHPYEQLGFRHLGVFHTQGDRAERRHDRQREDERAEQREAVGERQRAEDAPFDALQREDRNERRDDDGHGEERRLRDINRRLDDEREQVAPPPGLLRLRFVQHVFRKDDRAVDEDAEVHRSHRYQIRGQVNQRQPDERHQQRQRDDRRHNQRAFEAAEEQPDHGDDEQRAEEQVVVNR